jgi:cellulose synthase/poly-beta-1,6-N-acetylglucosamine synthase-like glycosyltransferase
MRVAALLAVVALAVLGALLHPLAFLLGLMPFDTRALVSIVSDAKTLIADLLAWGLVALLVLMLFFVFWGRAKARTPRGPRPVTFRSGEARPRIAVGIIAYNEAEAIRDLVLGFKAQPNVAEVIVVDNNSSDATAALASAAGARVLTERNQGYGWACIRALQEGVRTPGADAVALVEGDGTFDPGDLAKFQAYLGQADLVVGTRVVHGLVEEGSQMDYFFTWGNMAVGMLLRFRFWNAQFLGTASLTDVGCTYRVVRRDALERILPDLVIGGHHFSPHMLLVALSHRLSVIEIPVTFRRRLGISKGAGASFRQGLMVGLVMIWHILAYRPRVRPRSVSAIGVPAEPEEIAVEVSHAGR